MFHVLIRYLRGVSVLSLSSKKHAFYGSLGLGAIDASSRSASPAFSKCFLRRIGIALTSLYPCCFLRFQCIREERRERYQGRLFTGYETFRSAELLLYSKLTAITSERPACLMVSTGLSPS